MMIKAYCAILSMEEDLVEKMFIMRQKGFLNGLVINQNEQKMIKENKEFRIEPEVVTALWNRYLKKK